MLTWRDFLAMLRHRNFYTQILILKEFRSYFLDEIKGQSKKKVPTILFKVYCENLVNSFKIL